MNCKNCGEPLNDGDLFCTNCGAKQEQEPQPVVYNAVPAAEGNGHAGNGGAEQSGSFDGKPSEGGNSGVPEAYKPISMWGYLGYQLLFSIPCVGFILLLFFSFGGTKNINVRNFARSFLCYMLLIFVLIMIFGMGMAFSFSA